MSRWIRLRIWWWKFRYANHVFCRAMTCEGHGLDWAFCWDMATTGWQIALEWEKTIDAALKESPIESAEEEMSYWIDDEGVS